MGTDVVRVAIISTPRSGNCWLRKMLAEWLELQEVRTVDGGQVDWQGLPQRGVILLHHPLDAGFRSQLDEHGFRVIVLSRHPLDVLISILVYSQHDQSTLGWLDGEGGDERSIAGASPLGEAFSEYARGPRANALLGVSGAWWHVPGVVRVRYEDLVADTAGQLERIRAECGYTPRRPIADVVGQAEPDRVRALSLYWMYHIWQARPGLWKRLLTADVARRICDGHVKLLADYGYACDPDESLSAVDAQAAWEQLETAAVKRNVRGIKSAFYQLDGDLRRELESQREETRRLAGALAEVQQQQAHLAALFNDVPIERLRELSRFGPRAVAVARVLHHSARRVRRFSAAARSLVSFS